LKIYLRKAFKATLARYFMRKGIYISATEAQRLRTISGET